MASLSTTNTELHDNFEKKVREILAKEFTILPSLTYHDILGGDSDEAWLIRRSSGSFAQSLRCQPDILISNSNGFVSGIDVKTKLPGKYDNYCLEAFPIINALLNDFDLTYIIKDFSKNITKFVPLKELVDVEPKSLYVFEGHQIAPDRIIRLAKSIWPKIKIVRKSKSEVRGSGDHYLIFESIENFKSATEGIDYLKELS